MDQDARNSIGGGLVGAFRPFPGDYIFPLYSITRSLHFGLFSCHEKSVDSQSKLNIQN
jgi:hypothetical protein